MFIFLAPPGGLEPPSLAPEANALSTELWGHADWDVWFFPRRTDFTTSWRNF